MAFDAPRGKRSFVMWGKISMDRCSLAVLAATLIGLAPSVAQACAVCFGDPDSPLTKGAAAGILVLGGFIAFVLLGVLGTGVFWIQRGRRLRREQKTIEPTDGAFNSSSSQGPSVG